MHNPEFAKAVKSDNSHIYMGVLKENIMDELKLNSSATITEMKWLNSEFSGL